MVKVGEGMAVQSALRLFRPLPRPLQSLCPGRLLRGPPCRPVPVALLLAVLLVFHRPLSFVISKGGLGQGGGTGTWLNLAPWQVQQFCTATFLEGTQQPEPLPHTPLFWPPFCCTFAIGGGLFGFLFFRFQGPLLFVRSFTDATETEAEFRNSVETHLHHSEQG